MDSLLERIEACPCEFAVSDEPGAHGPRLDVLVKGERVAMFVVTSLEVVNAVVRAFCKDPDWLRG